MEQILLHVAYHCKRGMAEPFVHAVKASGVPTLVRGEDGCLQYDYQLSLECDDTVVLLERWRDRDALAAHLAQPHMQTLAQCKEDFVLEITVERFAVHEME